MPKPYSETHPARALSDVRGHNGYSTLKSVTPETSKLVIRSAGTDRPVAFATMANVEACKGVELLGTVVDPRRGINTPNEAYKILKMRNVMNEYFARDLTPGKSVIVRGQSTWFSDLSYGNTIRRENGKCGPLYSKFTPQAGHAYLVQFTWKGYDCEQGVMDATDPDHPVPIPSESIAMCPFEPE